MLVLIAGAAFLLFGAWLLMFIVFREHFLRWFVELTLAFFLALFLRALGVADEFAYFAFGMTLALTYHIRKL